MAQPQSIVDKSLAARDALAAAIGPNPPISGDNVGPNSGYIPSGGDGQPSRITLNPQGFPNTQQSVDGQQGTVSAPNLPETGSPGGNELPNPTPVDDINSQLEQRKAQANEALKAQGFDGYTPDLKSLDTPDAQYKANGAIQDIAAGFNISLAKTLSLPREVLDRGMGLLGLDYMQHGSPQQQTIDTLNHMGIPTYEVENLANKIGRGALPALATYTAMQLAAPSMAAQQGVGTAGYMMREIGSWAVKHPIAGLWLGQTSQAGGKIATNTFGDNPLTELGGELAGGAAPGAAKFLAGKIPGLGLAKAGIGAVGNAISDALPTDLGNAIKKYNPFYKQPIAAFSAEPLVNKNFDANRLKTFTTDQIIGAQTYQDKAIENAINSIPTTGTPGQVQARTHDLLQSAEKISKRIVSGFWDRVPLKTRIKVTDLRRNVMNLQRELVDNDNTRPDAMIAKVLSSTANVRLPNGQFKSATPTVAKLRDIQSQIGTAITEERARDAPREGQVRNLARLSEMIDENIANELPNDTSIEQARQMSKRHNDLFSRGPINDILSKRRTGDFRVPQADSIDNLLQKTDGLAALKAVQEGVSNYPRIPTNRFRPASYYNNPNAVTPQEKSVLDQLVKSAQDSIRSSFREAADQGPQKAVAYSIKNDDAIKALGNVAGELAFAAQKVSTALAEKKTIDASALARFSQTSPEKAVANIFAQRDPATVARQLMITFRGDPEALEGLRNQILDHFIYTVGKTNPNIMQKMIQEPRIGNLMGATLSGDQFQRLNRMINIAVRLGVEDQHSFMQAIKYPARTMGRIVGAKIGRSLHTGTIQTPGIISKAVGDWVERRFGVTDPQDLLSMAVLDPNWESLLYSRLPTTTRDMKAAMVKYRQIFAGINTAQQQTLNKLSKGDDNAE